MAMQHKQAFWLAEAVPESLFQYRADIELASTHKEVCEAAAAAMRAVTPDTQGFAELMTYAVARVQETRGQQ